MRRWPRLPIERRVLAGTDHTKGAAAGPGGGPAIVLVKPQMGENIGACARAMANFDLSCLQLVAPRDGWPNDKARAMASRADAVLDRARVFADTASALAQAEYVYAATARRRDMAKPVLTPRDAAREIQQRISDGLACAVLFGGERAGLDNADVVAAHAIIHVPANPAFASMNLAQAVLLIGYELYQARPGSDALPRAEAESRPAKTADLQFFFERLETELIAGGFLFPIEKRPAMVRNIRNMFMRMAPTDQDLKTWQGIVSALIRRRRGDA